MSNSPLVNFTKISPNKTSPRNHAIDTITIHCVVGQASVESLGALFASSERQASSNYGIGYDGRIGMYVEEKDRSWCSSNRDNDMRAITIEVASDNKHPYAVNDAAYKALIDLLVDICQRNNIKKLLWKNDKSLIGQVDKQNMTVHRWFANKECPGEYLFSRHSQIADEVNARLNGAEEPSKTEESSSEGIKVPFTVKIGTSGAEVRTGPGPSYELTRTYVKKGVYTIVEVKDGWGRLKSGAGWVCLDSENNTDETKSEENPTEPEKEQAESKVEEKPVEEVKPYLVKVSIPNLNIRKGPGTNYDKTGHFTGIGVFTIVETKNGEGSDSGWGRLKSNVGWISLDYTEKV